METKVDFEHNKRRLITIEDYLEGSLVQALASKDREGGQNIFMYPTNAGASVPLRSVGLQFPNLEALSRLINKAEFFTRVTRA